MATANHYVVWKYSELVLHSGSSTMVLITDHTEPLLRLLTHVGFFLKTWSDTFRSVSNDMWKGARILKKNVQKIFLRRFDHGNTFKYREI